jgi:hypothetical protein
MVKESTTLAKVAKSAVNYSPIIIIQNNNLTSTPSSPSPPEIEGQLNSLAVEEENLVNGRKNDVRIIGFELKIFKLLNHPTAGEFESKFTECSATESQRILDCRPFRYMRTTGNKLTGERLLHPTNAIIRQNQLEQSTNPESDLIGDYQQTIDMISYIECLYLKMFPEVPFSQMLKGYNLAKVGDIHINFVSMTEDEISAIIEIVTAIDTKAYICSDNSTVYGRESGYPLVARLFSAINFLHHLAGMDSPCHLPAALKNKLAKLKEDWIEHGAPSVVSILIIII